jgi:hypothetical protein
MRSVWHRMWRRCISGTTIAFSKSACQKAVFATVSAFSAERSSSPAPVIQDQLRGSFRHGFKL